MRRRIIGCPPPRPSGLSAPLEISSLNFSSDLATAALQFEAAHLVTRGVPADWHRYSRRRSCRQSIYVDILGGGRPLAHRFRRRSDIGKLIHRPLRVAITCHGGTNAPSVVRNPGVTDVSRPWMDCMGDGVDLLGIAGAHG